MIKKGDKIISMLLLNSHESDMTYKRPDNTTYVCQIRKNKPNTFYTPQTQLELPLDLPKPSQPPIPQGFPHQNIIEKKYGKDWKPTPNPDLQPH